MNNKKMHETLFRFHHTYQARETIYWYTKDSFLYRLLNQACRTDHIDFMFSYRFIIHDLHEQFRALYEKQRFSDQLIVYRGTILSKDELIMLLTPSEGKNLIWPTTFMSTSLNEDVAKIYAGKPQVDDQIVVLQRIIIDGTKNYVNTSFANIRDASAMSDEDEILLSIGTVFEMESIEKNKTMKTLLNTTLNNASRIVNFNRDVAAAYNNKGLVHQYLGEYDEALLNIYKSLDLRQDDATLSDQQCQRLVVERSYSHENLDLLHKVKAEYVEAQEEFERALSTRKR
ncbi:unnamed protein product [Didymodactylos carnosus]|uniref:NAD(P)(+)--arginine ADP-ribosyltransferase n=1 Tax=Didymodactylos carnosus TaxID=1234261 RepID=A0A815UI66_9BILA|nr:unnamed protein product [Didymodactylos carnosus]CAF4376093.1 unnamed protein product [Didymodactylos carnosus]